MFLPGHIIAKLIDAIEEEQVQPAGIDLRVLEVRILDSNGVLGRKERVVPVGRILKPIRGWWDLSPGVYRIRFAEWVRIPEDGIGLCFPRSSLLRMGAVIACAVWDPGYQGRGEALLYVLNPHGIKLERMSRVAQLVVARVSPKPLKTYNGVYQGEGKISSRP